MFEFLKKMSLIPKGLRYKTYIAFSLMAIIPLLISMWLVSYYIFPNIDLFFGPSLGNISFILFISIIISLLGFYIIKEIVEPVIKIAGDAKQIAGGDLERVVETKAQGEIGDLSTSLNIMTQKVRENIEELKAYGEKTRLINMEINKKVLALSSLLQIGNLISLQTELVPVLDSITQKLSDVEDNASSIILLLDKDSGEFKVASSCNLKETKIEELSLKETDSFSQILVLDKETKDKKRVFERFESCLGLVNIIMLPILVRREVQGMLIVGNKEKDFIFTDEKKELFKVFVKQASIALENDLLIKKAKELAVKDELTGLYNEKYIKTRLDEEIKRSILYQRPCGYILVDIDEFTQTQKLLGEVKANDILKAVGEILKKSIREVDRVGRLDADRFAIILPEKNKKQVANLAEEVRKNVEEGMKEIIKAPKKLTVSIGVSENPIDGLSADELMEKAESLVRQAKSLGKNRVAV